MRSECWVPIPLATIPISYVYEFESIYVDDSLETSISRTKIFFLCSICFVLFAVCSKNLIFLEHNTDIYDPSTHPTTMAGSSNNDWTIS
jgi:hypothetical protein